MHRARYVGRGTELPRPLWVKYPSSSLMCLSTQKLSKPQCLGVIRYA